jgi:hypothetical protein
MTVLSTVESSRVVGRWYEIRLGDNGQVYCTCPGWKFSKLRTCKHLKSLHDTASDRISGILREGQC